MKKVPNDLKTKIKLIPFILNGIDAITLCAYIRTMIDDFCKNTGCPKKEILGQINIFPDIAEVPDDFSIDDEEEEE